MTDTKSMDNAYKIAHEIFKDRLKESNRQAFVKIRDINQADLIVIKGKYDHIEQILSMSGMPFAVISPADMDRIELRPDQVMFVNCPGHVGTVGLNRIKTFVESGGFLFTTDWALKNILEAAFPGYVEYNRHSTGDEVVRVEILESGDPFSSSILGPQDDPQWWLEGSSYPIRILDDEKVNVLITSKEIKERYGEAPVFINFQFGDGKIYHMISHFYLQRSWTRTDRHSASAVNYLNEKNIPDTLWTKYKDMDIGKSKLGEVESAYTSLAIMNKILYDKKTKSTMRGNNEEETTEIRRE